MSEEKGRVQFGSRKIDFFVKRSNRRRTISLFVDPFEGAFLRAPIGPSFKSLSKLVQAKAVWILKKQKQIEEIKEFLPKREFISGETFLYLGRQLRLKVVSKTIITIPKVKVVEGRFLVTLNSHFTKLGKQRIIRKVLINWYKKHARGILFNRVVIYSKKLQLSVPEIFLSSQSKRWGSCLPAPSSARQTGNTNGRIRFNWHVVMAPMYLIDYVVAHELCHFKHNNHSQDFWKLLGSILPDYESRRERLRKEGPKYIF